jgi:hypothetical protein
MRRILAIVGLAVLAAAAAFIHGHYYRAPKIVLVGPPEPGWQATGDRFVDPNTHWVIDVYLDPRSGDKHYLKAPPPWNSS